MKIPNDPRILVGPETQDDAAVYLENDQWAHVATTDFFSPIVDDPFVFGGIAAANALSDIYAMGATPRFALNIAGFPTKMLGIEILGRILAGGLAKAQEAGVPILGGHTIQTIEPIYGLAVHGVIDPKKIVRNRGAKLGDRLLLTKPLGSGALIAGIRRDLVSEKNIAAACTVMLELNQRAGQIMLRHGVHAATDVTGFGFLGHLKEMVEASRVTVQIAVERFQFLPGAQELAEKRIFPQATFANFEHIQALTGFDPALGEAERLLLCDAQTSGGLLLALPEENVASFKEELFAAGSLAMEVGRVTSEGTAGIQVLPRFERESG